MCTPIIPTSQQSKAATIWLLSELAADAKEVTTAFSTLLPLTISTVLVFFFTGKDA